MKILKCLAWVIGTINTCIILIYMQLLMMQLNLLIS